MVYSLRERAQRKRVRCVIACHQVVGHTQRPFHLLDVGRPLRGRGGVGGSIVGGAMKGTRCDADISAVLASDGGDNGMHERVGMSHRETCGRTLF